MLLAKGRGQEALALYALYCPEATKKIKEEYEPLLDGIAARNALFQLTVERTRRYHGEWYSLTVPLFPNYLFFESEKDITAEMRGQLPLVSLSDDISDFLSHLFGKEHHLPMSHGYMKDAVIYVTEGPLAGYENRIVRMDRHKRIVWLKLSENDGAVNLGRESTNVMIAGLEIVKADEDASIPLKYGYTVHG